MEDVQGSTKRVGAWIVWAGLALPALSGCLAGGDDLTLQLGVIMPLTGPLNAFGPDMRDGARLAIKHVNEADAGLTIVAHDEDDGTVNTAGMPSIYNRLLARGVTATVGPCCSGVLGAALDQAVPNQIVVATPSGTSPFLTSQRDNQGYFWRVPPHDGIQGRVLAELVNATGVSSVNVIHVNNNYGNGLAQVFTQTFTQKYGSTVGRDEPHEEEATDLSSQVLNVCTPKPAGMVLLTYVDQGAKILQKMQELGCLDGVKLFGSEGVFDPSFATKAGGGGGRQTLAEGMRGTRPEADLTRFNALFQEAYGHAPGPYAAESYDAVVYVALATLSAGSTRGVTMKAHLPLVAMGGTKVTSFAEGARLLADKQDIDYAGYAHDFDFDTKGDPSTGLYSWWEIQPNGSITTLATGKTA